MKYILAVDLETTGLDPTYHEITEVGMILLDEDLFQVSRFHDFVNVLHPERGIEKKEDGSTFNVWEYTGIDPEELRDHSPIKEVLRDITHWVKENTNGEKLETIPLMGQNVSFDISFLKEAYRKSRIRYPFDYHSITLESIFFGYYFNKEKKFPERIGLNYILRYLEMEQEGREHSAMSDVKNTVKAFRTMIRG